MLMLGCLRIHNTSVRDVCIWNIVSTTRPIVYILKFRNLHVSSQKKGLHFQIDLNVVPAE